MWHLAEVEVVQLGALTISGSWCLLSHLERKRHKRRVSISDGGMTTPPDVAVEDAADIFDSSLLTLFDIPPIAFSSSSADRLLLYNSSDVPESIQLDTPSAQAGEAGRHSAKSVLLRLPQPPAELYTTLQANNLWLSSILLADLVPHIQLRNARIAELGAGAGLPGIVACQHGATVVSTDWAVDEVLAVIRENFERACVPSSSRGPWSVVGHKWGDPPEDVLASLVPDGSQRPFDLLFLADTLWVTDAHAALLDSILALLAPSGVAHITAGLHTGRGPLERFIAAAENRGARITLRGEVQWSANGWKVYDPDAQAGHLQEERGVVVYMTLHR